MGNKINKGLILNRIKEAYNLSGNSELARFLGVAPNTITNWYNRNTLDFDVVFPKCEELNYDWLVRGIGEQRKKEEKPIEIRPIDNEFLLKRFEEIVRENQELKTEKEQLKSNHGRNVDINSYTNPKETIKAVAEPTRKYNEKGKNDA